MQVDHAFWQGFFSLLTPGVFIFMGILIVMGVWAGVCMWPLWWPKGKK